MIGNASGIQVNSTGTASNPEINLDINPGSLALILDAVWRAAHAAENGNAEQVENARTYKAIYDELLIAKALAG